MVYEDGYYAKILSSFTLLCPEATSIIQQHIAELAAAHNSFVSVDSSILTVASVTRFMSQFPILPSSDFALFSVRFVTIPT